jgi:hypothetical protein
MVASVTLVPFLGVLPNSRNYIMQSMQIQCLKIMFPSQIFTKDQLAEILFRETIAVCSGNTKNPHANTLYGQSDEYPKVKTGGMYVQRFVLKSINCYNCTK